MSMLLDSTGAPLGERRIGRRIFLGALGLGLAGVASGQLLSPLVSSVAGLTTPSDAVPGFQIYYAGGETAPHFDPATWRLTVGGLVQNKLSLSYHDLLNLPMLAVTRNYHCVTGWEVPGVQWEGVSLMTLARIAGARSTAQYVNVYCTGGVYSESLRMPSQAFKPDVMLGYRLNRKPLARVQGAPLRLVVPEMYGYKYAKWVERVEFSNTQQFGYWELNGYTVDAYLDPGVY